MVVDLALYKVLEVSERATPAEIKTSYRRLSLLLHPDREGGDSEKFKTLSNAYQILSDPDLRRRYDQQGLNPTSSSSSSGGRYDASADEFFAQFFTSQGGRQQPPRASRAHQKSPKGLKQTIKLDIALEDLFHGKEFKLTVKKKVLCKGCKGIGAKSGSVEKECLQCAGLGQTKHTVPAGPGLIRTHWVECVACSATGRTYRSSDACPICRGAKTSTLSSTLSINVKKGMYPNYPIVIPNAGDESPDYVQAGDLVFLLNVLPHPTFSLVPGQRYALKTTSSLTLSEMLLGFDRVLLNHLDGTGLRIMEGGPLEPHSKHRLKLAGMGLFMSEEGEKRGDLLVDLELVEGSISSWVKSLDEEQLEALARLLPPKRPLLESENEVRVDAVLVANRAQAESEPPKKAAWFDEEGEESRQDESDRSCRQS